MALNVCAADEARPQRPEQPTVLLNGYDVEAFLRERGRKHAGTRADFYDGDAHAPRHASDDTPCRIRSDEVLRKLRAPFLCVSWMWHRSSSPKEARDGTRDAENEK
jgi:hypothetical protein